ncbi:MAG: ABC transporter permease [Clostridia bacterium]|nr:ABC transporter permease [Clostridia bacterium]
MTKYLLKRLLHGLLSIIAVVAIVMVMIYSMLDRNLVFAQDPNYTKQANNGKEVYKYSKWEEYGYVDYVTYADYLRQLMIDGKITEEERQSAVGFGKKEKNDSELVKKYVAEFTEYYESCGYTVKRCDAVMLPGGKKYASGGQQQLFAYKDLPLVNRLWKYFSGIFTVDNIHNVKEDVGDRGLTFTLHDPLYGGDKFAPAVIGNGTTHKYLVYFDNNFPYIHQNLLKINLGKSYSVNLGIDVFDTMINSQGSYKKSVVTYPTGYTEESADDLHTATYVSESGSTAFNKLRFSDDYTSVTTVKKGMSKIGYSFVIGIISVLIAYLLGVPLGIITARKKDKLIDKIGTIYIVFIIAVPSLAYIFLFKAIGGELGMPTTFDMESTSKLMFVLPIISLALPSIASLMKWIRRYMIDQMNSDYVKFARSGGLSESEIFSKHILKNAIIPIVHGIPGSVLGSLVGAIITERVYVVPGAGNLLTEAINKYDNGVIVGVTLFYAVLSVVSIIFGDILMSMVDPRISFSSKDR